ncbi:MAG: molybdopterin cofactor-binding domain-containing protein [Erythrobacter sp.]|jgi:isoquinoline 1-oxidoreductase beta subunit|nr:molybdopterin cofactor-binding domain-containing protein [Erythrobacter sp.]
MNLSRRGILAGAAAGGGLLVAWWLLPRTYHNPLTPGANEHVFGAWLRIGEDSVVTVAVPQLEMGQGVTTVLPQLVAMELGADWRQIAIEPAPPSGAYANLPLAEKWAPLWDPLTTGLLDATDEFLAARFARAQRFCATAEGTTLAAYEGTAREAGAAARAMLAQEAAERWGTPWEELTVAGGLVRGPGGESATFGELAAGAAQRSVPDPAPLRPETPREDPLTVFADAAPAYPRIDLPAKVDGSLQFAGDIRLPRMLHASIRHGPNAGAELTRFDEAAGFRVPGVVQVVKGKRWLAALAETWWSAERALEAMDPQFTAAFPANSAEIETRLGLLLEGGPSFRIAETGFGAEGMTRIDMARRYEVEPHLAAPLETASATARFADGRLELWIASQAPESARTAAAQALGIAAEDVALYPVPAGGSFDARLEHDHAIEVALLAREAAPRPVQLTWPRASELAHARPRPPAWMLLGAQLQQGVPGSLGTGGSIDALRVRIACPPAALEFGRRLFGGLTPWAAIRETEGKKDPLACTGAVPPYQLPSVVVEHVPVEIGLPVGRVRGNADGYTAFAIESFIDEIARRYGREPLSFRMAMLGSDIRLAACLQRAAQLGEWDGGAAGSGQGLACHRIGDGADAPRIACIATARGGESGVRVSKLSVAVDIGRIVNLDIARQQVEGGLVFGLGMALGRAPRWRAGLPASPDYADLDLPTLADCPEIEVDFIASEAPPADPGEIGAVVAPPAIANALFSATGLRLRRLPLLSDGI